MEKLQFEIMFSKTLSEALADEFRHLLVKLACGTEENFSELAVDSIDSNEIVFTDPLAHKKFAEYTVSWQKHLANIAAHNVYNHS
jgi:hypothetical protein